MSACVCGFVGQQGCVDVYNQYLGAREVNHKHGYMHTEVHTCTDKYLQSYTYMYAQIQYMHLYMHSGTIVHTYKLYIPTCIQAYMHE